MHRYAEDLTIDAQLLIGANPVTVSRDQGKFFRSKAHDVARSQLRRGGGLANPGRSHERIHATFIHQRVFVFKNGKLARQGRLDIGQPRGIALPGR